MESRFKHVLKLQKEARRTRRRSMSTSRERDSVGIRLEGIRKPMDPGDKSEFESRHSEPRDPAFGPSALNPAAIKPADSIVDGTLNEKGNSTSNGVTNPLEQVGMIHDPDHSGLMIYAPSSPGSPKPEHTRVLSFAGVGAHPNSTGYRPFSPIAEGGIYKRGQKKDITPSQDEQLHPAE